MKSDQLEAWMDRLVRYVRSGWPDLTNRQLALVMLVYRTDGPHTVRGIAAVLRVSKPVITRALNTLCRLGLVRRERDGADRRSLFIRPTGAGEAFLDGLALNLDGAIQRSENS
jgi:DNA-binding MarR family transcriptional regulator